MANSKYEYVKSFEVEDEVMFPNLIVVRVDGRDFRRFSEIHEFVKPNDEVALNLMNSCAVSVTEEFPDIVFSYGYSDEYSFALKKTTRFYQRRASKIQSLVVSFLTSVYVTKWKEFFHDKELRYPPSFRARVLSEKAYGCDVTVHGFSFTGHINNQHATCFHELVKHGKTEKEAQQYLKESGKKEKHDLLFEQFGINYEKLPVMTEDIVKYNESGAPVKRLRRKTSTVHSKNIVGKSFWNLYPKLLKELGGFVDDIRKIEPDYIRSFLWEAKLLPSTWIVIRIDGCHFHRFSTLHEFVKPNDERALNLMNSSI
ncbi:hypothetical protein CsatB_027110 [Cannabis sativa]